MAAEASAATERAFSSNRIESNGMEARQLGKH